MSAFWLQGAKPRCQAAVFRWAELVGDGEGAFRPLWWLSHKFLCVGGCYTITRSSPLPLVMTRLSELMHTVCNHASWDLTQIILKQQFRSLTLIVLIHTVIHPLWLHQHGSITGTVFISSFLSGTETWLDLLWRWSVDTWVGETLLYWQWACDFSSLTLPNIMSFPLMPCICVMASTASLWGKLISVFLTWTE